MSNIVHKTKAEFEKFDELLTDRIVLEQRHKLEREEIDRRINLQRAKVSSLVSMLP